MRHNPFRCTAARMNSRSASSAVEAYKRNASSHHTAASRASDITRRHAKRASAHAAAPLSVFRPRLCTMLGTERTKRGKLLCRGRVETAQSRVIHYKPLYSPSNFAPRRWFSPLTSLYPHYMSSGLSMMRLSSPRNTCGSPSPPLRPGTAILREGRPAARPRGLQNCRGPARGEGPAPAPLHRLQASQFTPQTTNAGSMYTLVVTP